MIAGIGVDLVDCRRVERAHVRWGVRLERHLLGKSERHALPAALPARRRRLAMALAAKEALGKALGSGMRAPVSWHQVRIERDDRGAPNYAFGARLQARLHASGIDSAYLSLSDDGGMALALAVLEKTK